MAKEVAGLIKLQIRGGAANPSPPVGPALGAKGVNIMEFCKQFNARTQDRAGKVIPVIITVSAPHRNAAFEACQYAIDTLKETVPIWKKEFFEDGEVWVNAHP